jgi:hypothetical protein
MQYVANRIKNIQFTGYAKNYEREKQLSFILYGAAGILKNGGHW